MNPNATFLRLLYGALSIIGFRPSEDEATFIATTERFTSIDQFVWMADRFPKSEHSSPTLRRVGSKELLLHSRRVNFKLKDNSTCVVIQIDCLSAASSSKHCASVTLTVNEKGLVTSSQELDNFANDASSGGMLFELIELRSWLEPFGVIIPEPTPAEEINTGALVAAHA